jgi:hypothetical protein
MGVSAIVVHGVHTLEGIVHTYWPPRTLQDDTGRIYRTSHLGHIVNHSRKRGFGKRGLGDLEANLLKT